MCYDEAENPFLIFTGIRDLIRFPLCSSGRMTFHFHFVHFFCLSSIRIVLVWKEIMLVFKNVNLTQKVVQNRIIPTHVNSISLFFILHPQSKKKRLFLDFDFF